MPRMNQPRVMPVATPDFLSPADADKAIRLIADSIRACGLFDPPPGMAACIKEAMSRASTDDIGLIAEAAEFLSELAESASELCGLPARAVDEDACCHL
jgi:hypothetical protein